MREIAAKAKIYSFNILERLLVTAWVGAIWAVGYLAVPVLFGSIDDRLMAGNLAGEMFSLVSYIGLLAGFVLLLLVWRSESSPIRSRTLVLLAVMVLLVMVGEFILQPLMAGLKGGGLVAGSEEAIRFAWLHGVSSTLYLINALLGLVLAASR